MQNNFDPLIIRGKSLIPVVQGGMGVAFPHQNSPARLHAKTA